METDASRLDMKAVERIGHFYCFFGFWEGFLGGGVVGLYNKVRLIEI